MQILGGECATCEYFDVSAFKPVTDVRFGNAGLGSFRGPSAPNLDMSLFRTFTMHRSQTLQLRAECFNVTNTTHFANPSASMASVTFNADGTIKALNGAGSITSTVRLGRQYDEREWRLGLRWGSSYRTGFRVQQHSNARAVAPLNPLLSFRQALTALAGGRQAASHPRR